MNTSDQCVPDKESDILSNDLYMLVSNNVYLVSSKPDHATNDISIKSMQLETVSALGLTHQQLGQQNLDHLRSNYDETNNICLNHNQTEDELKSTSCSL